MTAALVNDIQRQPAYFVAILVGNENGIVPPLEIRPIPQETPCNVIGRIHRSYVIGEFLPPLIGDGSPIHKIEVIKRHLSSPVLVSSPVWPARGLPSAFQDRRGRMPWFPVTRDKARRAANIHWQCRWAAGGSNILK
jgi:hypothetical protein